MKMRLPLPSTRIKVTIELNRYLIVFVPKKRKLIKHHTLHCLLIHAIADIVTHTKQITQTVESH